MTTKYILFQASFGRQSLRHQEICTTSQQDYACNIARELGQRLIEAGYGIILTGTVKPDAEIGEAAVRTCETLGIDPNERILTYPYGHESMEGFGMVMQPIDTRWMDARTFVVDKCDAIIAISGGKGTSDAIQKALLARKPVFPVATVPGASKDEWEKLVRKGYCNKLAGDIDFLGNLRLTSAALAESIVNACNRLLHLTTAKSKYSDRVFVVHGHDEASKLELRLLLEKLQLKPIILHEQVDMGRTIFEKLRHELSDVGFGFILLTPDDSCASTSTPNDKRTRARQNVVFEHGLLIGLLGPERVCAIVKGDIEIPSDLNGIIYKRIPTYGSLTSIALDVVKELRAAGYSVDANVLA